MEKNGKDGEGRKRTEKTGEFSLAKIPRSSSVFSGGTPVAIPPEKRYNKAQNLLFPREILFSINLFSEEKRERRKNSIINQQIERLLPLVNKPGRYVGGEMNSVIKEKREGLLRFAFCFPDTYEVGMSHLGMKILYSLFNER